MIFEKAGTADIEELTRLRTEYLTEDCGEIPKEKLKLIAEGLPEYYRSHLNKDLIAFVCRREETIAGCCFLYISEKPPNPSFPRGRTGSVLNVYTRPQYRKNGIARELMKLLIAVSEEMGLDFVELKATDQGYELYRSIGFADEVSKYHNMKFIIGRRNEA